MNTLSQRHEDLRRAAHRTITEHENLHALSDQVLTDVVLETLKKYREKLNVGIEDSVADLLDSFKQKAIEVIFSAAGAWQIAIRPPMLFPRGCRHCYTRGHSTIVVIEESPQTRSLSFSDLEDVNGRVSLSLPYVVFLLHFRDDVFSGMYCGWRTSPLRSLDDMLCRPLLPNIHDNLAVCMGHSGYAIGNNISQQCESIVSNFWNSTFNRDLSEMWRAKAGYHRNLESGRSWSLASEDDSMFILSVNFTECKSVQYIIDLLVMYEETPDASALRHQLAEQLDKCTERLFSRILRYFKKTKFDKHFPKDVDAQVKAALQDATNEFSDLLKCLDHEIKELGQMVRPPSKVKMEKRSGIWREYSP